MSALRASVVLSSSTPDLKRPNALNLQPDWNARPTEPPLQNDVVWWRNESRSTDIPRRHAVGWSTLDASHQGLCLIDSEHLRLSREQVETHLAAQLPVGLWNGFALGRLTPAYEGWSGLDPAVRIIADGHQVASLDLQQHYGQGCRAGVAAELRGQGFDARVVYDGTLAQRERSECLSWAERQLSAFRALDPAHLRERGWTQTAPSRWQTFSYADPARAGDS